MKRRKADEFAVRWKKTGVEKGKERNETENGGRQIRNKGKKKKKEESRK